MNENFDVWEIKKLAESFHNHWVISLKYENKVTVKKFPFMQVQNNAKLSSILGDEMVVNFLNPCAVLDFDLVMEAPKFPSQ